MISANWNSLDDQGIDGNSWVQSQGSNQNQLSELNPDAALELSPGEEYSFGAIFNAGTADLAFRFLQSGQQFATNGVVLYAALSTALDGDFDGDGDVDGRDFLRWQRGGSPNPLSASDLALWRDNYGQGSLSGLSAISVPEPSALLLCFMGAMALLVRKR